MIVKLADVCERGSSNLRQTDIAGESGPYPIYGASGQIGTTNFYHQEHPYVAVVKDGAGIGRTMLLPGKSSVIGTLQYLLPKSNVRVEFLKYAIQHMHLERYFSGATIPHIYFRDYKNEQFPLPSLQIQDEILALLAHVENIIAARHAQLSALDELVKARFFEMFGETNPAWPAVTISDVCSKARTGPFGSALHHGEFVESGIFVLGIDNAVENRFSYNRMRYITPEKYQQLKRYTVYPGDVIITIMGTVGRSAVIPPDMPTAINTKHLACLTPNVEKIDSTFLCSAFQMHPEIRRQLLSQTKGAIMDGLNLSIIKGLKFHLPPLSLQTQFTTFVSRVETAKTTIRQSLAETQTLFESLMQKYFGKEKKYGT